jgi:hypothetical protein
MAALTLIKLSVQMLKFSQKKKEKNLFEEKKIVKENRESIEIFNFIDMEFANFSDKKI